MNSKLSILSIMAAVLTAVTGASLDAQWSPLASNTTAEFRGLAAVSPSVIWASGTRGRVAVSIDSGRTWRIDTIPGAENLDLRAIHARNARLAWALSSGPAESGQARIFRTTDGTTWTQVFETREPGVFLDAMAFWDDEHGIVLSDPVGRQLTLFATDDAGATWSRIPTGSAPPMLAGEAAFAASGTCLTVQGTGNVWIGTGGAAQARVFRSTDRGRTWSVAVTPIHAGNPAAGIFSVAFSDASHGVAVGGQYDKPHEAFDNVALTADGGRTWRLAHGPLPPGYLSAVAFLPGTSGRSLVAVGLVGTATSSDGGDRWTMVDSVGYNSVAFASPSAGWAAGPRGRLAAWRPAPR